MDVIASEEGKADKAYPFPSVFSTERGLVLQRQQRLLAALAAREHRRARRVQPLLLSTVYVIV